MDYILDKPLSVAQVAKLLGTGESSVYRLVRSRQIKYSKIGGRLIIRQSWAEEFIERSTVDIKTKEAGQEQNPTG
jgi:excisionase family DNA binding protein